MLSLAPDTSPHLSARPDSSTVVHRTPDDGRPRSRRRGGRSPARRPPPGSILGLVVLRPAGDGRPPRRHDDTTAPLRAHGGLRLVTIVRYGFVVVLVPARRTTTARAPVLDPAAGNECGILVCNRRIRRAAAPPTGGHRLTNNAVGAANDDSRRATSAQSERTQTRRHVSRAAVLIVPLRPAASSSIE